VAAALGVLDDQVVEPDGPVQAALRRWIALRFGPALAGLGWNATAPLATWLARWRV
jgi:hypothetical protein